LCDGRFPALPPEPSTTPALLPEMRFRAAAVVPPSVLPVVLTPSETPVTLPMAYLPVRSVPILLPAVTFPDPDKVGRLRERFDEIKARNDRQHRQLRVADPD
jgi:hypothetical protein